MNNIPDWTNLPPGADVTSLWVSLHDGSLVGAESDRQEIQQELYKLLLESDVYTDVLDASTKAQYALAIGRAGGFESNEIFNAGGDVNALLVASIVIDAFPKTPEKIRLLQTCSTDGHPWCTGRLADDYLNGGDGLVIDHALGIKLLTKLAHTGYDARANGLSQAEDIQLLKTTIEHGNVDNAISLAYAYLNGDGVPKSIPIAFALMQTLIQRTDVDEFNKVGAIEHLAPMCVDGTSMPVNEQLFLRILNPSSLSDKVAKDNLAYYVATNVGSDTLTLTESTRLLLLNSMV